MPKLRRGTCAVLEAAPGSCPARAAGGKVAGALGSGVAWPWSHCLSPRPGSDPAGFCFSPCYCCCYCQPRNWAPARPKPRKPTGFACPANAKVRGRGPQEYLTGGAGLAEKSRGGRPWVRISSLNLLCAWLCAGRCAYRGGRESRFRCTWSLQLGKNEQLSSRVVDGDKGSTGLLGLHEKHLVQPRDGGKGGV